MGTRLSRTRACLGMGSTHRRHREWISTEILSRMLANFCHTCLVDCQLYTSAMGNWHVGATDTTWKPVHFMLC